MTIVVGVDGSAGSEHALAWAMDEARRRATGILLVHGWAQTVGGHADVVRTLELLAGAARAQTDRLLAEARTAGPDLTIDAIVVARSPAAALVDTSAGHELLVVGSHGHGALAASLLGSVADACVRHATTPVVVVRPAAVDLATAPVVVGVDGSANALDALRWARAEAALRDVPVTAVHSWLPPAATELAGYVTPELAEAWESGARAVLDEAIEASSDAGGPEPERRFVNDVPAHALLDASRDAALLVVGSRGLGGFTGLLLGSVSHRCVHAATCPVVVVPSGR